MINVVVAQKKQIRISTNATSTAIVTNNPVTLKDTPSLPSLGEPTLLSQLADVDVSGETDGAVLQYHASSNSYILRPLSVDVGTSIDGGVF